MYVCISFFYVSVTDKENDVNKVSVISVLATHLIDIKLPQIIQHCTISVYHSHHILGLHFYNIYV